MPPIIGLSDTDIAYVRSQDPPHYRFCPQGIAPSLAQFYEENTGGNRFVHESFETHSLNINYISLEASIDIPERTRIFPIVGSLSDTLNSFNSIPYHDQCLNPTTVGYDGGYMLFMDTTEIC